MYFNVKDRHHFLQKKKKKEIGTFIEFLHSYAVFYFTQSKTSIIVINIYFYQFNILHSQRKLYKYKNEGK